MLEILDGCSAYGDVQREGIYLRKEAEDWLIDRAKLVAPEFTQAIDEHWSRGALVVNEVAGFSYGGSGQ